MVENRQIDLSNLYTLHCMGWNAWMGASVELVPTPPVMKVGDKEGDGGRYEEAAMPARAIAPFLLVDKSSSVGTRPARTSAFEWS